MNSRVFALFAGVVILFGAYKMLSPDYGAEAKTRVTNVLRGMQAGTGTVAEVETATCMWAQDKIRISDNLALSAASNGFTTWRREKDLYRKIGDFTIDRVEKVKDATEDTAIVSF